MTSVLREISQAEVFLLEKLVGMVSHGSSKEMEGEPDIIKMIIVLNWDDETTD